MQDCLHKILAILSSSLYLSLFISETLLQQRLKMDRRRIQRFFGFWKWTKESSLIQKFFEDLWRIFELMKILRIRLRSILRNQRIFVFVFGPFSIFVATLFQTFFLKAWKLDQLLYWIWILITSDFKMCQS